MLTAYFDDSGTHDQSDVVCWAGLFGNHYQWEIFDVAWAKRLAESVPGKAPVQRFHMYDCQAGDGEFLGWSRLECDFFARELSQVIIKTGLYGYAIALSRRDWDAYVQGDRRKIWGDAEAGCVANCFLMAERWATKCAPQDKQLAFVFDKRLHRTKKMEAVFEIFQSENRREKLNLLNPRTPDLVSLIFGLSSKFRPLQAADLWAWELYQNASDVIVRGMPDRPRREQLRKLVASGRFVAQIGTPDTLRNFAMEDDRQYATLVKHTPIDWPF